MNWKHALAATLVFTFIGLPAIGQETGNKSLEKFDLLGYSSELMMTGKHDASVELAEDHAQGHEELDELSEGVQKLSHDEAVELSNEHQSLSGEPEGDGKFIQFLKKVFGDAMSF